jgi:hypothetical protein
MSSAHGTLVASSDVVLGPEHVEMPQVPLLDSTTFHRRARGRRGPAFSVLRAYGYAEGSDSGRLLHAVAYRSATELTWEDFLPEMPGMPEVVLSDGRQDVIGGIGPAQRQLTGAGGL